MADNELKAAKRSEFGKGAARRLRRAGDVPAVLYGHGTDPIHIALPGKETFLILRQANVLLQITVDGESQPIMALPKQVTRDPITGFLVHVDLLIVRAGEKVTVDVPVVLVGEAERGSMVNHDMVTVSLHAPATSIPEEIEVSLDGLSIGDHILTGDLKLPEGCELAQGPEDLVVNVVTPPVVELEERADAEGEAAEGEAAGGDANAEEDE